ncbi:hypothetical protein [Marmoricola sp. RAF53]|uniref:hypothetical protein n=1 Tax=Marmoricola sp. RAF53 TaxID=3233059 RepID=UPI003F9D2A70
MQVRDELEPNGLARWRTSDAVLWKERLEAINPRFQIRLQPELVGLDIEIRPDHYSDEWRLTLDWPARLDSAVQAVEEIAREYEEVLDTYQWFKRWITASMSDLRPGADPTTACLAFGYLYMAQSGAFVEHSIAIVDALGERVVPPQFEIVPDNKADWSYRFHEDGTLDVFLGAPGNAEFLPRQLAGLVGQRSERFVTLKTWLTSFRDLRPALAGNSRDWR